MCSSKNGLEIYRVNREFFGFMQSINFNTVEIVVHDGMGKSTDKFASLQVFTNTQWEDESYLLSNKAPTTILFDKDGKFHSFGFEAEKKYAKLSEEHKHGGWQYFSRFKMKLFESRKITKDVMLTDEQGNTKIALEVLSAAIRFTKDHLFTSFKDANIITTMSKDIMWVLTVPAIWDDGAKQFMQEAAKQADIPQTRLILAPEPECAVIYCRESNTQKAKVTKRTVDLKAFEIGAQFMVVDLGDQTVEITAHEVSSDGSLKELTPPSGGPWGGMVVDAAYFKFLRQLFTDDVMDEFETRSKMEHLALIRQFQRKRKFITSYPGDSVLMHIPLTLFEVFKDVQGMSFETSLQKSAFSRAVRKTKDKLVCDAKHFISMYTESTKKVIPHIRKLLAKPELVKVTTFILIGELSESEEMYTTLKQEFQDKAMIVPDDASWAVVKGAVMYGFKAATMNRRHLLPFTHDFSGLIDIEGNDQPRNPDQLQTINTDIMFQNTEIEVQAQEHDSEPFTCIELRR